MDFGRETPKFRFEFCRGFSRGFFPPIFFQGKRPEKIHQKIPRKIHPGLCSEKFPSQNGVSNFLRSIGHFFFVHSNCWGPVTSENKCVWAPKPCIMRSFGLKMRQKQVRETFRKVCQTCFCAIIAVCRRDF